MPLKGRFILEIIEGMVYLSEQGLVHKDLKPENILVDNDFHIKVLLEFKMEKACGFGPEMLRTHFLQTLAFVKDSEIRL